jgi:hypothetical protein
VQAGAECENGGHVQTTLLHVISPISPILACVDHLESTIMVVWSNFFFARGTGSQSATSKLFPGSPRLHPRRQQSTPARAPNWADPLGRLPKHLRFYRQPGCSPKRAKSGVLPPKASLSQEPAACECRRGQSPGGCRGRGCERVLASLHMKVALQHHPPHSFLLYTSPPCPSHVARLAVHY